jgi:leader peptidase (prepilin peptidase) / N-methyltransferase
MEAVLPLAGIGFALGWPIEWVVQRFPMGVGTPFSARRRWFAAALTAALFAALTYKIGFEAKLVPALLLTALVVPAALIDLKHRIIPDYINLPGAVLVYIFAVSAQPARWLELLLGGVAAYAFLWVAWRISPKGMGKGDVKMALMMGLGLGKFAFAALFAAFILSTLLSGYLLLTNGKRARKMAFPFGPFLAFGTVVALLYGPQISPYLLGGAGSTP